MEVSVKIWLPMIHNLALQRTNTMRAHVVVEIAGRDTQTPTCGASDNPLVFDCDLLGEMASRFKLRSRTLPKSFLTPQPCKRASKIVRLPLLVTARHGSFLDR